MSRSLRAVCAPDPFRKGRSRSTPRADADLDAQERVEGEVRVVFFDGSARD